MAADDRDRVVLGVVTRPHGVRGELRVHLHNPDSELLFERERVLVRTGDGEREVGIDAIRRGPKGAVLLWLEGVRGREAAEALRGAELCIPRSELPAPGEDEWYHVDLVGLEVRDREGRPRGEVVAVVPYPTVDALRVRGDDGEREVPMVEQWLVSVDVAGGAVVVDGLEELPLEPKGRRG